MTTLRFCCFIYFVLLLALAMIFLFNRINQSAQYDVKIESICTLKNGSELRFKVKVHNNGILPLPDRSYSTKIFLNDKKIAFSRSKDSRLLLSQHSNFLTTPPIKKEDLEGEWIVTAKVNTTYAYKDYDLTNNSITIMESDN